MANTETSSPTVARVRTLLAKHPLIDGHNDLPWAARDLVRYDFDKLDLDHNGQLAFQEYAAKAIDKFNGAGGKKGWLSEAEFATTAPPRSKKRRTACSCRAPEPQLQQEPEPAPADDNNG